MRSSEGLSWNLRKSWDALVYNDDLRRRELPETGPYIIPGCMLLGTALTVYIAATYTHSPILTMLSFLSSLTVSSGMIKVQSLINGAAIDQYDANKNKTPPQEKLPERIKIQPDEMKMER